MAADRSLQRLESEYIDLYQLHRPNEAVPIEETMAAMEELVDQGKVRFIGVSNFSVVQLQRAQAALAKYRIVSNQVRYSLVDRQLTTQLRTMVLLAGGFRQTKSGYSKNLPCDKWHAEFSIGFVRKTLVALSGLSEQPDPAEQFGDVAKVPKKPTELAKRPFRGVQPPGEWPVCKRLQDAVTPALVFCVRPYLSWL